MASEGVLVVPRALGEGGGLGKNLLFGLTVFRTWTWTWTWGSGLGIGPPGFWFSDFYYLCLFFSLPLSPWIHFHRSGIPGFHSTAWQRHRGPKVLHRPCYGDRHLTLAMCSDIGSLIFAFSPCPLNYDAVFYPTIPNKYRQRAIDYYLVTLSLLFSR